MIDLWSIFIKILPLLAVIAFLARRRYQYWERKGLKGPFPVFPIGYFWQRVQTCPKLLELQWWKQFGRVYGVFMGLSPVLTISDPELIKQVLVKDFHLFINRRDLQSYHNIWTKNLFFIGNAEDWKRIRSISSPAFTTGKLRKMYDHMHECIGKLKDHIDSKIKDKKNGAVLPIKTTMVGFTLEAIFQTSFGMSTSCYGEITKSSKSTNPFNYHGQRFFDTNTLKVTATASFPTWLLRILNIPHHFPADSFQFLEDISRKIIRNKQEKQTLVGLLQEASISESELKNMSFSKLTASGAIEADNNATEKKPANSVNQKFLSEDEIIAQCILFQIAGFETTSSALSCLLFELAKAPEEQEKLFEEVSQVFEHQENSLSTFFDRIMTETPYLEASIKEALRLYPTVYRLERRLSKEADNYKLGGVPLEKNQLVEISTMAIHYDPEYWTEPERFSPSRFMPENKHLLVPYTYLPFGDGPRNCIGMRFAYQEMRFCMAYLIKNYIFECCDSTPEKLEYFYNNPILIAKPFNLRVRPR